MKILIDNGIKKINLCVGVLTMYCLLISSHCFADNSIINRSAEFFEKVKMDGYISQGLQSIEADQGAFDPQDTNMSLGFNRLRFALGFSVDISDNIDA